MGTKTTTTSKAIDDQSRSVKETDKALQGATSATKSFSRETDRATQVTREATKAHKDHNSSILNVLHSLNLAGGGAALFGESIKLLKAPAIIGAIQPLAGAILSLAGSTFALGSSLAEVGNLAGVLPAGLLSVGLAGVTAKIAFGDLAKEIRAVDKAAASGDPKKLQEELDKLSPSTRQLVQDLRLLKSAMPEIKDSVRQALLENGLQGALEQIGTKALPVFRQALIDTATALGRAFKQVSDAVTSDDFLGKFAKFAHDNQPVIVNLGAIVGNLAKAFINLAVAGQPIIQQLSDIARRGSEWAAAITETGLSSGKLAGAFQSALDKATQLARIFRDVIGGIHDLAAAVKPFGDTLLDSIEKAAQKFRAWADDTGTQSKFRKFLDDTKPVITEIFGLVGDLIKLFARLGTEGGGQLAPLIGRLRDELLPVLAKLTSTVSQGFLDNVISLVVQLAQIGVKLAGESGPLNVYVQVLTGLAKAINFLIDNVPGFSQFVFLVGVLGATFKITSSFGFVVAIKDLVGAAKEGNGPIAALATGIKGIFAASAGFAEKLGAGAITSFAAGVTGVGIAVAGVVAAVTGAIAVYKLWNAGAEETKKTHQELAGALKETSGAVDEVTQKVAEQRLTELHQNDDLKDLKLTTKDITDAALGHRDALVKVTTAMTDLEGKNGLTLKSLQRLDDGTTSYTDVTKELAGRFAELVAQTGSTSKAFDILSSEYQKSHANSTLFEEGNKGLLKTISDLSSGLKDQANDFATTEIAQGKLTQAYVDSVVAQNTASDGTVNYGNVLDTLRGKVQGEADAEKARQDALDASRKAQEAQTNAILAANDANFAYADAQDRTRDALDKVNQIIADNTDATTENDHSTQEATTAYRNAEQALDSQARTLARKKVADIEATGAVLDGTAKQGLLAAAFRETADTLAPGNPLRQHLLDLATSIESVPSQHNTDFTTNAPDVSSDVAYLDSIIRNIPKEWDVTIRQQTVISTVVNSEAGSKLMGDTIEKMATGGIIGMASGGFRTKGPTVLVGEGNQAYPEYVIPTDPKYRDNSFKLLSDLLVDLDMGRPPSAPTSTEHVNQSRMTVAHDRSSPAVHIENAAFMEPVDVSLLFAKARLQQRTRVS